MASARRTVVLALALVASLVPIVGAAPALAADHLVVNEIMNNPDAVFDSAGEWFEVHNPGSEAVDIDGFTIRDDGSDSHVIANGGPLMVPAGGFVVLGNNADSATNGGVTVDYSYGSNWFLSNSGDEVIIEDLASVEVDRVENDGGPSFPDPTGASMALFDPALDNNTGGNWCESPNPFGDGDLGTPGVANDCAVEAVELVVNEIMNNPAAVNDADGEWFEVHNPGSEAVDIDGFTIRDDGSDSHVVANGGPLMVPAGGFVVLGNNADSATNGGVTVDYSYGSNWFLSNSGDEVIIEDLASVEVDRVEYDGGPSFPDPTGASMALFDPALDNNTGGNWCESPNPFGDGDLGTPGVANDCAVEAVELVVNEIMNNPAAVNDADGEWFEVHNPGSEAVDIDGFTIRDDGSDSHVVANGGPLMVPAGGFVVLGNNADSATNGGVTVDYSYGSNWFLSNSGDEVIIEDLASVEVDRVEYDGGPSFPDPTGASMALVDPALDNNTGGNWCESPNPFGDGDLGTPGDVNVCVVKIHEVQGPGDASPIVGARVIVEGVVVGDEETFDSLAGFFVQEEDLDVDGDPMTSEGVFVFNFSNDDVDLGDVVRVEGTVEERFGNTQLTDFVVVDVLGVPARVATPTVIEFPIAAVSNLEWVEGMAVAFPQDLVVTEYFNYDRFGEVVVALPSPGTDRPMQPTAVFAPGSPEGIAMADLNARSRITIDDGQSSQNPDFNVHPIFRDEFGLENAFRGGDEVTGLGGPIYFSFGEHKIYPNTYDAFNQTVRDDDAPRVSGRLEVATLNALNYFLTLDDGVNDVCGANQNLECRGADTEEEFLRQRAKLLQALARLDADVVGLVEIENTPGVSPLADIVEGLNDMVGKKTYDYVDTGTVGDDAIKVGFIYKRKVVKPYKDYAVLDTPEFLDPNNTGSDRNRAALAVTFNETHSGQRFSVVVNHFKSKGSSCGTGDDDQYAGSCNLTRTLAAQELMEWIDTDPTKSKDKDWMILGDLNSYDKEDPIVALQDGGYRDLIAKYNGEYAYTYVFSGQWGYLDYAMANVALSQQVSGTKVWNLNSDEPDIFDYDTSFKSDSQIAMFEGDLPYRSSDHDAVIVGLDLRR